MIGPTRLSRRIWLAGAGSALVSSIAARHGHCEDEAESLDEADDVDRAVSRGVT